MIIMIITMIRWREYLSSQPRENPSGSVPNPYSPEALDPLVSQAPDL
jgi:hypothetical protein